MGGGENLGHCRLGQLAEFSWIESPARPSKPAAYPRTSVVAAPPWWAWESLRTSLNAD